MRLAVLFSGGKDSCLALNIAKQHEEVVCLITINSENKDSYMYHTPNIHLVELQAEKLGLPLILKKSEGIKEEELQELKDAIKEAKNKYSVEGIVTGAVESAYQASRVQRICDELNLECFNPLWQKDQVELLNELITKKFTVIIGGIAAYPFDETWLGKKIDSNIINRLINLQEKIKLNPAGEGGEYESFVVNSPDFSSPIKINKAKKIIQGHSGVYLIEDAQ